MIKFLKLIFVIGLLGLAVPAFAQESSQSAVERYKITFPVAELGNCNSLDECKTFCSDVTNKDACIAFAKKKGFYSEQAAQAKQESLMAAAKTELGCDSADSCKAFCGEQQNWVACGEFAKKHGLGGGPKKPEGTPNPAIVEAAKQFLGCDSLDSCKALCSLDANHQKCEEFSKMMRPQGPGGGPKTDATMSGKPDGCTSAECRAFCDKNPQQCGQFRSGAAGSSVYSREKCHDLTQKMASASAEEIKAFYLKNCVPASPPPRPMPPVPASNSGITKEQYCQQYPGRCSPPPTTGNVLYSQATYNDPWSQCLSKGVGYYWNGTGCQFSPQPSAQSQVQGVSRENNFLQNILQFLGFKD